MATGLFLPGNILSLHRKAADRLLAADNGDAALLYLWLLKTGGEYDAAGAARALKWDPVRADGAMQLLAGMKLADPKRSKAPPAPAPAMQSWLTIVRCTASKAA